ncbi:mit-1-15 [Drosophila busckii]|uniref:Centromere/kinetochore protein zw10 n=1 Tax=Drosophila busckii TaxID=30019 RepID=A0A0M4EUU8_DROBS|nr:centromere/kinetochore protein zw10 [Drosophila busckii]ALC49601.1 mit-1-15 [Drosophila busckii]
MEDKMVLMETFGGNNDITVDTTKSAIAKMIMRTEGYQTRVRKHIDDNYVEFMPNYTSPDTFLEESSTLINEVSDLLGSMGSEGRDALKEAGAELAKSKQDLREMLLGLRVSEHILKVDQLFQCVEEAKANKDCLIVLDLMSKLHGLIYGENTPDAMPQDIERVFCALDCYETIKVKYHVQAHLLQQNLQERFDRLVQFNCKTFPNSKCVTLLVSKDESQLQDIVMALFQERYNPAKLCLFLLENCIEPLIQRPMSVEYDEHAKHDSYIELKLSYSTKETETATLLHPNYQEVFKHFRQLLKTLQNINVCPHGEQYVFSIIGDHIKQRTLQLLVNECLMLAVPETMEEYQSSTLCTDVAQFEQQLADTYLINPEQDTALSEFVTNYHTYFRNRLAKRVLATAREIIQRDLQDMVQLAASDSAELVPFPRCMISKSALDFAKLMDRVLRQPSDKTDEVAPFSGIISILLNTYIVGVPKVHKKLLDSIPQQSALFYNNCMYLTHIVAKKSDAGFDSCPELIKLLQSTGNKQLRAQLNYQESILLEILSGFEFESPHSLGTGPLRLVRQCLRQLELLKNVWQQVLPAKVYNSSFCDLLHCFANELIQRVFSLRDISATMASELSDLIDVVLEKAPLLFEDPAEVLQVRCWFKLKQLRTMMNASLKEITELWCDGAGVLTANYKSNEVKHLIRALFQDTDRRAKAMAQIV